MTEFLVKSVQELSEDEKRQIISASNSRTEILRFSSAGLQDCVRVDGLGLNIKHLYTTAPTIHIPKKFRAASPSKWLSLTLKKIHKVWVVDNEKASRLIIDAILTEILSSDVNPSLLGFCEVRNDWAGNSVCYAGCVDYMIGTSFIRSVDNMDSFLLIVEAKKEWPDSAVPQVICEAGCLLKRRLAVGKKTPVFAALTNGFLFRFFAIDVDGTVFCSGTHVVQIGSGNTYTSSPSLSEILRWFAWILTSLRLCSPCTSEETITQSSADDQVIRLRRRSGPRNK